VDLAELPGWTELPRRLQSKERRKNVTVLFDLKKLENDEHIIRYLTCFREMITDLRELNDPKVTEILTRYSVQFIDADMYPRVGLLFPEQDISKHDVSPKGA
jgi:hypothetical protein